MKLILITLVALIIGGMVACGEKAEQPLKQRQQQPPTLRPGANPTKGPYLTEKLVLGLMNQYAAEGKLGFQCIRQHPLEADDTKEFRYEAGYWEVLVSGPQCDGVEAYRVKDSANAVITRIRPAWVAPTPVPPTPSPTSTLVPPPTPTLTPAGVHYEKASDYSSAGAHKMAIDEYTKAIQLSPNSTTTYWHRGMSYEALGQYESAIDDYTEAIRIGSHDYIVLNSRVTLYLKRGEHQAAIDDYNELIRISPTAPGYYKGRAAAYRALGHISLANADQAKACSLNREFC